MTEKTPRKKKMTPEKVQQAIGMRTAGMPTTKIAQAMEVTPFTVRAALEQVPNLQEQIDTYRQNLRLKTIKTIHDLHGALYKRIEEEIPAGSAKDVDALFRAAHASEKISSAVAGEAVKVEVTGDAPQVEIKQLLMQLGLDGLKALQ